MMIGPIIRKMILSITLTVVFCLSIDGFAQRNGDSHGFQGLAAIPDEGIKARAMGGAFTAVSGDLNALFYNPAGLIGLKGLQISISFKMYNQSLWEHQTWFDNKRTPMWGLWFEGLVPIPSIEQNGMWNYEIYPNGDSFELSTLIMGEDPFSNTLADWQRDSDGNGFNNVAAAMPFKVAGKQIVVSGTFLREDIFDYDRNDVYLDPHVGIVQPYWYDPTEKMPGMHWSKFERNRNGTRTVIRGALAVELFKNINLGVGYDRFNGETDDLLSLEKIGYLDVVFGKNEEYRFWHEDGNMTQTGMSKFRGSHFEMGTLITLNRFSVGLLYSTFNVIEREWSYETTVVDSLGELAVLSASGTDKMSDIPGTFTLGLAFRPIDRVLFAFDWETTPYSKSTIDRAVADTTIYSWADRSIYRFGLEYKPLGFLSILAGYRYLPEVYIPYGAAMDDRGPEANCYSIGVSVELPFGRLDAAYEFQKMRYYDSFVFSRTYNSMDLRKFLVSYTLDLDL